MKAKWRYNHKVGKSRKGGGQNEMKTENKKEHLRNENYERRKKQTKEQWNEIFWKLKMKEKANIITWINERTDK